MNINFFQKFFGYFENEYGVYEMYTDDLGNGFKDVRHLIWILLVIVISIIIVILARKHKKNITRTIKMVLVIMIVQRIIKQILLTSIKAENPVWRSILPIHLCSIMIYLLPVVVLLNLKKIKRPTYYLSILGGTITMILGDYFNSSFINYCTLEAIFAHSVLIIVPITMISIENERFTKEDVFITTIMILIIGLWATMMNCILGILGYQTDYLYMVNNVFPRKFAGKYFVLIYELIFFSILFFVYYLSNIKEKELILKDIKEHKLNKIIILINVILLSICAIMLTNTFAIPKTTEEERKINSAINKYQLKNSINQKKLDVEELKNILKEQFGEDTLVREKKNNVIIIFKRTNNWYKISKYRLSIVSQIKANIINRLMLKVSIALAIIILFIDILFILIKRLNKLEENKNAN